MTYGYFSIVLKIYLYSTFSNTYGTFYTFKTYALTSTIFYTYLTSVTSFSTGI